MHQASKADLKLITSPAQKHFNHDSLDLDALLMNQSHQQISSNMNTQNQIQHAQELMTFWKKNNINSLKVKT